MKGIDNQNALPINLFFPQFFFIVLSNSKNYGITGRYCFKSLISKAYLQINSFYLFKKILSYFCASNSGGRVSIIKKEPDSKGIFIFWVFIKRKISSFSHKSVVFYMCQFFRNPPAKKCPKSSCQSGTCTCQSCTCTNSGPHIGRPKIRWRRTSYCHDRRYCFAKHHKNLLYEISSLFKHLCTLLQAVLFKEDRPQACLSTSSPRRGDRQFAPQSRDRRGEVRARLSRFKFFPSNE